MHPPVVSVVICTRNRCASLAQTLASIADDPSTTPAEVIVANNASSDRTGVVLTEAAATSPRPFTTIWTAVRGHSRVRNEALRAVRGAICLFTDDDVTVEPGWIDAIAHAFADPKVDAVGGRVIPVVRGERPTWMTDQPIYRCVTLWDEGPVPFQVERGRFPIGANMAFRVARLPPDPFDPRLGHTGRASLGNDEWELFDRLIDTHTVMYEPRAVVRHWIDANRLTFDAVRGKVFQIAVGAARQGNDGKPLPTYPRRIVRLSRVARAAIAARSRNRRVGLDAESAVVELRAWQDLAAHMETLFGSFPRISEWISTRV